MRDTGVPLYRLTPVAVRNGRWTGVLSGAAPELTAPVIDLKLRGAIVGQAEVTETRPGAWAVSVALPGDALSDGVQTFMLVDRDTDMALASFAVSLGEALDQDLRAEMDLLREELDLLKRAFRRHCTEG